VEVTFVVEEAGCASCGARVQAALEPLAAVESIDVDEAADEAVVRLSGAPSEEDVAVALAGASEGSGHAYRLRAGSWRAG
jgi:copper chaperone CopZ